MFFKKYKKIPCTFLCFFSLFFCFNLQAQDFQWARQFGNEENDTSSKLAIDNDGNSYVIGATSSLIFDLDPTVNGEQIVDNTAFNHLNFGEIYISKLDKDGNFMWGKTFSTYKSSDDSAVDIKIGTDNNIYLLLVLNELNSGGTTDPTVNIIKLSPNGTEISRRKLRNLDDWFTGTLYASSFDLDNQNNIYLSGIYKRNVRLHPTDPSFNLNSDNYGQYLLKLNSDGDLVWKKTFSYIGFLKAIVRDDQDIDVVYNNEAYTYNIFNLSSLDGSILWQKNFTNQAAENFGVDLNGNIIISGVVAYTTNDADVNPSSDTFLVTSRKYFLWLDKNGNFLDVKEYEGDLFITGIKNDNANNVYFAGFFNGTLDADPSSDTYTLKSAIDNYHEGLVIKFNAARNFESAFKLGEENIARPNIYNLCYHLRFNDFVVTEKSQYYVGDFAWDCDLNPSSGVESFNTLHNQNIIRNDGFILKLGLCNSEKPTGNAEQYFCSSQNPTISNLKPNSTAIKWYESETSTNQLSKTHNLTDGQIYYASQQTGDCPENSERLAVTVHIAQQPILPVVSNLNFCKKDNPKIADVTVIGENIKWYDKAAGGDLLPETNLLKNQDVYYISQTVNGCESERLPITVTVQDVNIPLSNSPQTFCVQQNATLNDIQITGQNIKWYSNLTNGTLVSPTTVAQDKATYYASQTINGCESERVPVKINIQVTFSPTGNANQQFCTAQNATITNLEITGTSIKWYDSAINGSLLTETTSLEDGKTYYASQTINNCEGPRFGVTVSIVTTPSIPSANQEQAFCKKENKTLNDIQITGQNIKWFDSNFSATVLPNTTVLEDNRTYYASQTIGCESDRVPILVHVYDTPLPTGNNNQQFCIDQLATLENLNITGTALKWYDSASNGNLLSETDLLESKTYYVTQTLNNCDSERFAINVKIQDTQIPIADSPQQFCIQKNAKISDIEIIGQNLKWYESVSSSISLSESAPLENGIVYYVSQKISNCESDRIPVTINILEATTGDCINFVDELPFPKFFTPNGDGFNDTWTIESAYLAPNSSIRIFDRYGKFIKELPLNTAWNGTYLGNQQPASDYWFTVTRINGIEFRGHFSLKR